jgi:hypothetical protein
MSEQLQSVFFSKDTIAGLNKVLMQQSNYQNLNREGKEKLINVLIKNMKTVYRSLDTSKINKENFNSIFEQFKKHSVIESIGELKKSNALMDYQQSSSDLKFQRDFKSNPNPGNKFMDRPESTKIITNSNTNSITNSNTNQNPSNLNQRVNNLEKRREEQRKMNDPFSGFSSDMGNYDSSLDQAFKPIVDNLTDQEYFNNYDTGRNSQDINARMENIQQMRQNEVGNRVQKPPTPDFLKPKKTNPDRPGYSDSRSDNRNDSRSGYGDSRSDNRNDYRYDNRNDFKPPSQSGGKPDFQNMSSSEFNRGFQGLANDTGDNLMSLDNIDKPLIDEEMIEDNTSFEDRLKRLQSDRDNIKIPQSGGKVDFTSDNFPKSEINSNDVHFQTNNTRSNNQLQQQSQLNYDSNKKAGQVLTRQQQLELMQQQARQQQNGNQQENRVKFNDNNNPNDFDSRRNEIEAKRNGLIREAELRKEQELRKEIELRKEQELRKEAEMRKEQRYNDSSNYNSQYLPNDKFNDLRNSMKSVNIDVKEDTSKINNMKQQIDDLNREINNLTEIIDELKQENLILKQNNDYERISEIKKQIADEFEVLSSKNSELDTKTAELNLRELEVTKKDGELKQLIKNYDYLFRSHQLQIEVTSPNNESKYTFPLEKVNDALGIKLMSYSIPQSMFNIEEDKNNELKLLHKDNEIILTVPTGKYNIDEIIEILNDVLKEKNLNETINIKINKQQKIIIQLSDTDDEISIIPTVLSRENLGFVSQSENKHIHIADRIWDLRMDDKVYLFLNNLSDEVPFGILHFNGKSVCQFKFEKPFNMDKLDIEFKDSKGLPINFHNLPHNLSFMIEKLN